MTEQPTTEQPVTEQPVTESQFEDKYVVALLEGSRYDSAEDAGEALRACGDNAVVLRVQVPREPEEQ